MKKRNLSAQIFLYLFFFTLITGSIAIVSAKVAHNRDPEFLRKVALQVENKINKGETKPFSETNEQDLKGIRQITIRAESTDIEAESYDGNTLKVLYEGDMRKNQEGPLMDVENRNGEVTYRLAGIENHFVSIMWNGTSKGIIKSDSNVRAKILVPKSYTGDLQIHLLNGDTDMENLVLRNLTIKAANGDVELDNVKGQALEVVGNSGDLHATDSRFTFWSLKRTSGDIHLELPVNKYIIISDTINGEVKIDPDLIAEKGADKNKASRINIKLINGDISVDKFTDEGEDRE